ncbi:MAG: GAF domain-containing protein, partial [Nitrospirae bacterium]|nr:GAF domain-containing protein [Nitrospirota bacterium]
AGWVFENKTPLILSGRVEDDRFKNFIKKTAEINSAISLPIKLKGKVIGILNLSYLKGIERAFTERDMRMLSLFSRYMSTAIEHTQLAMKRNLVH